MKKQKKIQLLKVLAFPVSAWFMFNVGVATIHADEVNTIYDSTTPIEQMGLSNDINDINTGSTNTTTSNNDDSGENNESDSKNLTSDKVDSEDVSDEEDAEKEGITYETHVQDIGWQDSKEDGELAGTTGESKRLEAIEIQIDSQYEGNVVYQTHVQDIGWQSEVTSGEQSGTTGQSKRLEAIRIWLTEDVAEHYSIQYRTHIQNLGWQEWVSDGLVSGTTNRSLRLEAIEIKLVELIQSNDNLIQYTSHVQNDGWKGIVTNGSISGTTGQSKRLEAFVVYLNNSKISGNISYQAHVQDIGWQSAVSNRSLAGTTGQSKRIEAIRFTLDGDIAEQYDIYYRVHTSDYGWFDWASNGTIAGTTGLSKKVEAIEIKLVEKGTLITSNGFTSIRNGVAYYSNGSAYNGTISFGGVEYTSQDGQLVKTYMPVTYYSQRDGRWSGTYIGGYSFGSSGCCVTVFTSVVNKLLGTNYNPVQIGQIAHNAGHFNAGGLAGTSADGIVYLCNYFGLSYKSSLNQNSIKDELLSGHLVMAALGYNVPLCPWYGGITHEVLLYGYNKYNDMVNVNDPYNSSNNGEYSLSFIASHPSTDSGDCSYGGPYFSIYKM